MDIWQVWMQPDKPHTLIIIIIIMVLLSSKTPLVEERWDCQGQQVFTSLLHFLQCGDHARIKKLCKKVLVLQTIILIIIIEFVVGW